MMEFTELHVGLTFRFMHDSMTTYRKVSEEHYTYNTDKNAVWQYWSPPYVLVCKAEVE